MSAYKCDGLYIIAPNAFVARRIANHAGIKGEIRLVVRAVKKAA